MDVLLLVRVALVAAIASLAYIIGQSKGREKGFYMTMWAIEHGFMEIKKEDDGILVTLSETVDDVIKDMNR